MEETHEFQPGDIIKSHWPEQEDFWYCSVVDVHETTLFCRDFEPFSDLVFEVRKADAVYVPPLIVTAEQLKSFGRYEISVRKLAAGRYPYERVQVSEPVELTAEDLLQGFRQAQQRGKRAVKEWLEPMACWFMSSKLLCFKGEDREPEPACRYLPTEEESVQRCLRTVIFGDLNFTEYIAGAVSTLEQLIRNRSLPALERQYSEEDRLEFVHKLEESPNLESATEQELALYVRFLDELEAAGNQEAMELVGYACYGGNRAYPCDWSRARDIFLRLIQETGDPVYANTLGYIYYYHRCPEDDPGYEKAFYYFSIGAAGGIYESRYKLADMFRKGLGVPKNADIESRIICELYRETLQDMYRENWESKFADVALRRGRLLEDDDNPAAAEYYYLQARFAIRRRRQQGDYYGDASVEKSIVEALAAVRKKLLPLKDRPDAFFGLWDLLFEVTAENQRCRLKAKQLKTGWRLELSPEQDPNRADGNVLFLTIPSRDLCQTARKLTLWYKPAPWHDFPEDPEALPDSQEALRDGEEIFFDSAEVSGDLLDRGRRVKTLNGWFKVRKIE